MTAVKKATKKTAKPAAAKSAAAKKAPKQKTAAAKVLDAATLLPSAFSLFGPSIQAIKKNTGTIIGLVLTPILASVPVFFLVIMSVLTINAASQKVSTETSFALNVGIILVYVAMMLLCVLVTAALMATALHSIRGQRLSYGKALTIARRSYWRFLGLTLSVGFLMLTGLVLLIVPGVIVLRRYFLAPYYLLDRNMGVGEAMRHAAADSQRFGGIWDVLFVVVVICLFCVIPGVGWVVSLILTVLYLCGPALRYEAYGKLSGYKPDEPSGDAA